MVERQVAAAGNVRARTLAGVPHVEHQRGIWCGQAFGDERGAQTLDVLDYVGPRTGTAEAAVS
jgi:hypothetical protein